MCVDDVPPLASIGQSAAQHDSFEKVILYIQNLAGWYHVMVFVYTWQLVHIDACTFTALP